MYISCEMFAYQFQSFSNLRETRFLIKINFFHMISPFKVITKGAKQSVRITILAHEAVVC